MGDASPPLRGGSRHAPAGLTSQLKGCKPADMEALIAELAKLTHERET